MRILSIETSCDETAISLLQASGTPGKKLKFTVKGDTVLSQAKLHKEYGGVFPNLAKREHARNLVPVLLQTLTQARALKKNKTSLSSRSIQKIENLLEREHDLSQETLSFLAGYANPQIDAIAVTQGPGLEPALWVGINFAKALATAWQLPLLPINHMEGHIVSTLLATPLTSKDFPALALLISGGHTELVMMRDWFTYEVIGQTRDDAVGEAFDKVARMLSLPYPGGPEISKLAARYRARKIKRIPYPLPRPMLGSPDFDFSFSGLKTAVLYTIKKIDRLTPSIKEAIAGEFENAAAEVLLAKTLRAMKKYEAKTCIVGGGVIANTYIRNSLQAAIAALPQTKLLIPDMHLTTDNSLMIGIAGYLRYTTEKNPKRFHRYSHIRASGTMSL